MLFSWKGPVFSCVYRNNEAGGLYSNHVSPHVIPPRPDCPPEMTVSGTQRVWPMCIALAVAVAAVCISMQLSMIITLASIALAAYLPSYVDGAEYTGERFWPRFAEFMRERAVFPHTLEHEEPLDATKQYIYCSHPHGLISAHHGNMLAGSTAPCTMPIVAMWRVVLLKDLTGLTLCSLCSLPRRIADAHTPPSSCVGVLPHPVLPRVPALARMRRCST